MAEFRATITMEIHVKADDLQIATEAVRDIARKLPQGCRLMNPPEIELRAIRPVDRRMVTHLPNLARERLESLLLRKTADQQLILTLCIEPQWSHTVYTALRKVYPDIALETIAAHIRELREEGWLETTEVPIDTNMDMFPKFSMRPQWTPHGNTKRASTTTHTARS